jgi:hypothetical protein
MQDESAAPFGRCKCYPREHRDGTIDVIIAITRRIINLKCSNSTKLPSASPAGTAVGGAHLKISLPRAIDVL